MKEGVLNIQRTVRGHEGEREDPEKGNWWYSIRNRDTEEERNTEKERKKEKSRS